MIIKSLELENIRSYEKATINFEEGINFLSGDIGSGKSSILQAIEFAFLGFKKGDLEAEHLLRKGKTTASIKLILTYKNQEIEIFRKLKKSPKTNTITQESGYIKTNDNLIELSPTQLTTYIFDLLSFPKDFLSKDKNLIYRFTIYSKQEHLKEILYTTAEKRLEIIRKIFQIDKYKQIKNASNIYLTKLRENKKITKTKLEQFTNSKTNHQLILNQLTEIEKQLTYLKTKEEPIKNKLEQIKQKHTKNSLLQEKLKETHFKLEKNLNKIELLSNQLEQLKKELEQLLSKKEKVNTKQLTEKQTKIKNEIEKQTKNLNLLKKQLQNIEKTQTQLKQLEKQKEELENENKKNKELETEIKLKKKSSQTILLKCQIEDLKNKITKLNKQLQKEEKQLIQNEQIQEKLNTLNIKKETNLQKITELKQQKQNILTNHSCKSCLQKINETHKKKIENQIKNQIDSLKQENNKTEETLKNLQEQIKQNQKQTEKISAIKEQLNKCQINLELITTNYKIEIKKEKEINKLEKTLSTNNFLETEKKILEIQNKITSLKETLDKKTQILTQINELNLEIEKNKQTTLKLISEKENYDELIKTINNLEDKIKKSQSIIEKKPIYLEKITKIQEKLNIIKTNDEKLNHLKEKYYEKYRLITNQISSLITNKKQKEELLKLETENLKQKEKLETLLKSLEQKENFIIYKLIPICDKIEITSFSTFYCEFNEIFELLFKKLIEDNQIEVRLNSEFTPIIEQNGYEIDISNLSGGEKSSIALSYRLGLKNIIETNITSKSKLSLLILDEPTDGFSEFQINKLGETLKNLNLKQIILVSHDTRIESIATNIIDIIKENHESKII